MTALRSQVQAFIDRELTPEAMAARMARDARAARDEAIRRGIASPNFETAQESRRSIPTCRSARHRSGTAWAEMGDEIASKRRRAGA